MTEKLVYLFDDICEHKHRGADTSVEANAKITPHKASSRAAVLDVIRRKPSTLDEIAEALGTEKHKVSGRVTELRASGLIEVAGRVMNAAGNTVRRYKVKDT